MPQAIQVNFNGKPKSAKKRAELESAVISLVSRLEEKYSSYRDRRRDKEQEWIEAIRNYEGFNTTREFRTKREQAVHGNGPDSSCEPTINITRPKTNLAKARIEDAQFPVAGSFNYSVVPPVRRDLEEQIANPQAPLEEELLALSEGRNAITASDEAVGAMKEENERARRMREKLAHHLRNTMYGIEARNSMHDLVLLGTAVLKGPTLSIKTSKRYDLVAGPDGEPVSLVTLSKETIPTIQRVDPRLWFPDPNARNGIVPKDCFEIHPVSAEELSSWRSNPAFDSDAIKDVLASGDKNTQDLPESVRGGTLSAFGAELQDLYVVKEYHGPINHKALKEIQGLASDDEDELLDVQTEQWEIWFVNNKIIRMSLSHIDGDITIPYAYTDWERDTISLFGHGVPYLMRHAQTVANASYRMLLDNAGLATGPQIVLNRELISPADRQEGWDIAPLKVWLLNDPGATAQEAMQFVNIPSNLESISSILNLSMSLADMESNTPLLQQGEVPIGTNTSSSIAQVQTAQSIEHKRISQAWDDNITVPIISRLYDYEMQFGTDPSVKGDFLITAGSATDSLDRQLKGQELERALALAASNPDYAREIDAGKAFRQLIETTRVGDILRTPEEVEAIKQEEAAAAENAPPDPDLLKAQASILQAQASAEQVRIKQLEVEMRERVENSRVQAALVEAAVRQRENQIDLQIAQNQERLKLIEIASSRESSIQKVRADLQLGELDAATKRLGDEIDFEKFQREIDIKEKFGEGI